MNSPTITPLAGRAGDLAWSAIESRLLDEGFAQHERFLSASECIALRDLYLDNTLFRSRVVMERHNFGSGEYKYFSYPLPESIAALREAFYRALAPVANRWNELLGVNERFPPSQQQFLEVCGEREQARPTALLLRYRTGDYNRFHQDLYGDVAFPFQVTFFLSAKSEYEGGEFVLTEQRPRAQTRPMVIAPDQGDFVIIPNRYRPVSGKTGRYRTTYRHGVSALRAGERFTLGIVFHDAR
ncbi:MAG: 2OG-Fe(II) oxygenase [Candidatus Baltobacteraceae bacterium]